MISWGLGLGGRVREKGLGVSREMGGAVGRVKTFGEEDQGGGMRGGGGAED